MSPFFIVLICDIFCCLLREEFDTWHTLAKARNEGRLFQRINWPRDPQIVSYQSHNRELFGLCKDSQIFHILIRLDH